MEGDIQVGGWLVQPKLNSISGDGKTAHLEPKAMQVLVYLAKHAGDVAPKERIIQAVWADTFVTDDVLTRAISELRKAFGDDPHEPRFIQTIAKSGYRLIAPVSPPATSVVSLYERRPLEEKKPPAVIDRRYSRGHLAGLVTVAVVGTLAVLLALNVAGLRRRLFRHSTRPAGKIMLVVLPFENLSGDPEQEYFSDGMTEEMTTQLGCLSPQYLGVIGRASAMTYKGRKKTIDEIGKELRVQYILQGSVRRAGDRVRVSAQLVEVGAQTQVWAEEYDRDLRDILALQSEVARAVAEQIRATLTLQEQTRLASARAVNPEAYRHCLIGRFLWNKRSEEGLKSAIDHFQRALEIDPGYAPAYAGLADSYIVLSDMGFLPPKETVPRGKAAAQKALEIDESLAEAHASLGLACFEYDWDWPTCEKELKRAIELNPNYASAHQWLYALLQTMGRRDEALAEVQRAQQLDPLSPIISLASAYWYLRAGQRDEAIRRLRDTVSLFPEFADAYVVLGDANVANGAYQEGIIAYQKARSLSGASAAEGAALAQAYAKAGIRGYYLWELQRLREEAKHRYVRAWAFALIFADLGEKDQALSYLERAYEDRDYRIGSLRLEARFDSLRSDPRFQALVRRMNFPP